MTMRRLAWLGQSEVLWGLWEQLWPLGLGAVWRLLAIGLFFSRVHVSVT